MITATAVAKDTAAIVPTARYATKIVTQEMEKLKEDLVFTIPLPPSSASGSSSDENRKSHKGRMSRMKVSRCKSSVFSSDRTTWSPKRSVKQSFGSSMTSKDGNGGAPIFKDLHATDSHFWGVINFNTYGLLDKLQTYNGKPAAHLGEYAKCIETLKIL